MPDEQESYAKERDLVAQFAKRLRKGLAPWGRVTLTFEFDYTGGYADVVALTGKKNIVAFEAKLMRWRDALHQAYRTRCFAHQAYVVLPSARARVALRHGQEFLRRRVGLCAMSGEHGIQVLIDAEHSPPLQPWLVALAMESASTGGGRRRCLKVQGSERLQRRSAPIAG